VGEYVDCVGWRFEVLDLDGKRIDKVLASLQAPQASDNAAGLDQA
jgi:putative hemolysin